MGKASPGFEIGVVGVDALMPFGEEGELCVRTDVGGGSRWIFKGGFLALQAELYILTAWAGYLKEGKIDKRERVVGGKTWYCTGDRGFQDKDGYFWYANPLLFGLCGIVSLTGSRLSQVCRSRRRRELSLFRFDT